MLTETAKKSPAGSQPRVKSQLRSMTGFAQTVLQEDGCLLTVTMRSVNHRTLDLHLNLPEQLSRFEPVVRKEISALNPRGHLQLRVTLERGTAAAPAIDEALIGRYIELFRRVGERHGLSLETSIQALSQLPGVVAFNGASSQQEVSPELEATFLKALKDTIREWDAMRAGEGAVLAEELRSRATGIQSSLERLEQLRVETLPLAQEKLRERLQAWLGQSSIDSSRLAQEAAMLAEHTDVSEEVLRLKAHLDQFVGMLDGNPEIGKKLDFLLQEIQRELNTLLAKTTGLGERGLGMTQTALEIKGEVEKLREQVQNVQ